MCVWLLEFLTVWAEAGEGILPSFWQDPTGYCSHCDKTIKFSAWKIMCLEFSICRDQPWSEAGPLHCLHGCGMWFYKLLFILPFYWATSSNIVYLYWKVWPTLSWRLGEVGDTLVIGRCWNCEHKKPLWITWKTIESHFYLLLLFLSQHHDVQSCSLYSYFTQ